MLSELRKVPRNASSAKHKVSQTIKVSNTFSISDFVDHFWLHEDREAYAHNFNNVEVMCKILCILYGYDGLNGQN